MRRKLCIFLSIALLVCLLAGCETEQEPYIPTGDGLSDVTPEKTEPPAAPKEQQVSLVYDPDHTLNPYQATSDTNRTLFALVYQSLFAVDQDYQISPVLCESYNVSVDMKTYTFHIERALFSDGTSLTAEDVTASLEAARGSAWYGGRLQHVVSIQNYGDAVVIELDTPMSDFLLLMDIPIVKASQINEERPLGTGPYRYDGERLRKVAGWWCSAQLSVRSDTIALIPASTAGQIRDSFEFAGASLVCADPSARDYVAYHSDYELWESDNGLFLYLVCNETSPVFSNLAVRSYLTFAIDRDTLAATYYHGFAQSTTLPCSPDAPWYISSLADKYNYFPELFREALEQSGFAGSEVTLLYNGDDATRTKVAQAIAQSLTQLGLQVNLLEATGGNFAELLAAGEYDFYLAQTRLSRNMDVSAFFGMETALNYGGLSDPGIYALCQEALANEGNYYALYEMILEDAQLCPILFQSNAIYAQRGVFDSLSPSRDAVFYYDLGRTLEDALLRE